jgi:transposase-like protein
VKCWASDVGDSENETFWREFLTGLVDRGLAGVRLMISDAHAGLVKAIRRCFQGAAWQRCRVHAMRNLLAAANHRHRQVIAALIRTIFVQPDRTSATTQLRAVVEQLRAYAPGVAERLEAMETDLLAYTAFPAAHWSKIWSNNPIERLNRALKRRTDVVGIFPDKASVIRLVGALLVEINDEMIAAERRYIAAASVADLTDQPAELALPAPPRT